MRRGARVVLLATMHYSVLDNHERGEVGARAVGLQKREAVSTERKCRPPPSLP